MSKLWKYFFMAILVAIIGLQLLSPVVTVAPVHTVASTIGVTLPKGPTGPVSNGYTWAG